MRRCRAREMGCLPSSDAEIARLGIAPRTRLPVESSERAIALQVSSPSDPSVPRLDVECPRQRGRSTDAPAPESLGGSLLSNPNMDSSLVIARSRRTARAGLRITTLPPVAVTRSDNSRSTCSPLESMKLTPARSSSIGLSPGSGTSANASTNVRHVQASISPVTNQPCGDLVTSTRDPLNSTTYLYT